MTRLLYLGIPLLLLSLALPAAAQTPASAGSSVDKGVGARAPTPVSRTARSRNNWPFCPAQFPVPARPVVTDKLGPNDIEAEANKGDMVKNGMSHFEGDVEFTRGDQQATADAVDYSDPDQTAVLTGNVNYWDSTVYLHGNKAQLNFNDNTGDLNNADYTLIGKRGRGKAKNLFLHPGHITRGTDVDFTTCGRSVPGHFLTTDVWRLSATRLTLNYDKERAYAHNVVLWVKKIPVFYTPYLTWPLTKDRKSGFLTPSVGYTNTRGFEALTPIYWNIAPNMDATFTPRVMTSRGVMAMGQYRYLFKHARGDLNLEYIPVDKMHNDQWRGRIGFRHIETFSSRLRTFMMLNRVTDRNYFGDFGSQLTHTSTRYLQSRADLYYSGSGWNMLARLQDFQITNPGIPALAQPYTRLPEFRFNLDPHLGDNRINYDVGVEADNFVRYVNGLGLADVNGIRLDLSPSISYPYRTASGYIEPKLTVRYTQYDLRNKGPFHSAPNRLVPLFSIDSGLEFDRTLHIGNGSFVQTLEPRLYYLYVPHVNQNNLPVFDSGLFDPSYTSQFLQDRFTGSDRIGDANRLTLAIQTRLFNNDTGTELAYFRLAQPVLFANQDVLLQRLQPNGRFINIGSPYTHTLGPFIMEAGATILHDWHLRSEFQWDPNNQVTQKAVFWGQYLPGDGRVVNVGYRVQRGPLQNILLDTTNIEQTDVSFQWPVTHRLSIVGRWNYAVPQRKTLEMFAGIEYESCCWGIRLVARRYLSNIKGTYSNGMFLQVELKGLAGIGEGTESFLKQRIPGYEGLF